MLQSNVMFNRMVAMPKIMPSEIDLLGLTDIRTESTQQISKAPLYGFEGCDWIYTAEQHTPPPHSIILSNPFSMFCTTTTPDPHVVQTDRKINSRSILNNPDKSIEYENPFGGPSLPATAYPSVTHGFGWEGNTTTQPQQLPKLKPNETDILHTEALAKSNVRVALIGTAQLIELGKVWRQMVLESEVKGVDFKFQRPFDTAFSECGLGNAELYIQDLRSMYEYLKKTLGVEFGERVVEAWTQIDQRSSYFPLNNHAISRAICTILDAIDKVVDTTIMEDHHPKHNTLTRQEKFDRNDVSTRGELTSLLYQDENLSASRLSSLNLPEDQCPGTAANVIKLGSIHWQLEAEFKKPTHGNKWKYTVSLDTAFDELKRQNFPRNADEYVMALGIAMNLLHAAVEKGIQDPKNRIGLSGLERLMTRNQGPPKLCAWATASNICLVINIIDRFLDPKSGNMKERPKDPTSLTGYIRDRGPLSYSLYGHSFDLTNASQIANWTEPVIKDETRSFGMSSQKALNMPQARDSYTSQQNAHSTPKQPIQQNTPSKPKATTTLTHHTPPESPITRSEIEQLKTQYAQMTAQLQKIEKLQGIVLQLQSTSERSADIGLSPKDTAKMKQALAQLEGIDPRFKSTAQELTEKAYIAENQDLTAYSHLMQKVFNEAFFVAGAMSSGQLEIQRSRATAVVGALSSITGGVPLISAVLALVEGTVDTLSDARKRGQYTYLSNINPTANPIDAALFSEKIARRLAITHESRIMSAVSGTSDAMFVSELGTVRAFISRTAESATSSLRTAVGVIDTPTAVGLFGRTYSQAEWVAYRDAKVALEYILSGNLESLLTEKTVDKRDPFSNFSSPQRTTQDKTTAVITTIVEHVTGLKCRVLQAKAAQDKKPVAEAPIVQGSSTLSSGHEIEAALAKLRLAHQAEIAALRAESKKREEEIFRLDMQSRQAHSMAKDAKELTESVFQTVVTGSGNTMSKAVATKAGAVVTVVNSELEHRTDAVVQEVQVTKDDVNLLREQVARLEAAAAQKKKQKEQQKCVVS